MFGTNMTQEDLRELYDANVVDESGDKIGGVGQIYLDDQTERPTWATVKTGLFGTKETFVPLAEASLDGVDIRVPYSKDFVKDAPQIDADHHITAQEEDELYSYYQTAAGDVRLRKHERAGGQAESRERTGTAEQTGNDEERANG